MAKVNSFSFDYLASENLNFGEVLKNTTWLNTDYFPNG